MYLTVQKKMMLKSSELLARSGVAVADALPFCGEDHEHKTGQKRDAQWQVLEKLLGVHASVGEEAVLQPHVAESHGEEHQGREDGAHEVQRPDAEPPELGGSPLQLLLFVREVEDVETSQRGDAIVELFVAAEDAVGKGEEDAQDGEDDDQRCGEPLVGGEALAVVGERR